MTVLVIFLLSLLVIFGVPVFFGPPFLRSHKKPVEVALELLDIGKDDTLVDFGSGDGAVLIAAAEKGAKAIGIEFNPAMWLISQWRTRNYRDSIKIIRANMWHESIPESATAVYIFMDRRYRQKFDKYLQDSDKDLKVASYSYSIPGRKAIKSEAGVYLYHYPYH